jgi:hypothetical protein
MAQLLRYIIIQAINDADISCSHSQCHIDPPWVWVFLAVSGLVPMTSASSADHPLPSSLHTAYSNISVHSWALANGG